VTPTPGIDAVLALAREDIRALDPYKNASWEPGFIRLHANESPWPPALDGARDVAEGGVVEGEDVAGDSVTGDADALHRYPQPQPPELLAALAAAWGVAPEQVLVGRGSDEAIDLLTRAFCAARIDTVIVCPPTFGMYAVAARIQGAAVRRVPLVASRGYALDVAGVCAAIEAGAKLVWLCTPNNPTGTPLAPADIEAVLEAAAGRALVVIDEAYAEFTDGPSWTRETARRPGLATLRTLSKAHALAGARMGAVVAAPEVIALLRRIVPPYAVPGPTLRASMAAMRPAALAVTAGRIALLRSERERLAARLHALPAVAKVWPSAANFLLVEFQDAADALARLRAAGVLVRDFRGYDGLGQALRLTIGSPEQNDRMLEVLS
jgi:histidinol-phosphate aminotransferase